MPDWRAALGRLLAEHVFPVPSAERLFNPYRDRHPALDQPGAPAIRRANLLGALAALPGRPEALVLAEAPGPWGCRFSGVPFTSEAQLLDPAFPIQGEASSVRAEHGEPHGEYSGAIYWRVMAPYRDRFWTWNAVPLHPHRAGEPLTIRTPTAAEVRAWHGVVAAMLDVLRPSLVVAVGRKAEGALAAVGAAPHYVRHPSQGGARRFEEGIRGLFGHPVSWTSASNAGIVSRKR